MPRKVLQQKNNNEASSSSMKKKKKTKSTSNGSSTTTVKKKSMKKKHTGFSQWLDQCRWITNKNQNCFRKFFKGLKLNVPPLEHIVIFLRFPILCWYAPLWRLEETGFAIRYWTLLGGMYQAYRPFFVTSSSCDVIKLYFRLS